MKTVKITPSEIGFLFDRCQRCWWGKVNGIQKPRDAFPVMFQTVDSAMKLAVKDIYTMFEIEIASTCSFEKVLSAPIIFEDLGIQFVISGKVDKAVTFSDDTYGIAEFKMAEATAKNIEKYWPQTMCYEWALRDPANGRACEVSRVDLFFLTPCQDAVRGKKIGDRAMFSFTGEIQHVPVEIDRSRFEQRVLRPMAEVAASIKPPEPGQWCETCASLRAYSAMVDVVRVG